jgi:glycosyltransferase involved in cell wall biosynthesis/tetratricopeptide (TPR) repeat protein
MSETPKTAVSYNFITIHEPTPFLKMLDSVYKTLFRDGDETIVVDTGSSPEHLATLREALKGYENCKLIEAKLAVDYRPLAEKHLKPGDLERYAKITGRTYGILDFAAARQIALDASTNPVFFWCDSDDTVEEDHPGRLRETVDRVFADRRIDVLFLPYHYGFDEEGNLNTLLSRERFIRRGKFRWAGRCHEAIVDPSGAEIPGACMDNTIGARIVHGEARTPGASDFRNYLILRTEYDETLKTGVDPRTVMYLGNACRGLRRFHDALVLYEKFDMLSGSIEDRYNAWQHRAAIYMDPEIQRPFEAIDCFLKCLELNVANPRGYYGLQTAYYALQRHPESLHWYKMGCQYPMPEHSIFSYNPGQVDYFPHVQAALSHLELNQIDEALKCAQAAVRKRPNSRHAHEVADMISVKATDAKLTEAVQIAVQVAKDGPARERIVSALTKEAARVPDGLMKQGVGRPLDLADPRPSRPLIAIYCPPTGEPWGPISSREIGSGGSEKMVILLAEALQASGKVNVTVFSDNYHEERGVSSATGVRWEHFSSFKKIECHTAVFWRCPESAVYSDVRAQKRVLWLHDVTTPDRITTELLCTVDYVQVQSQFHAEPIKSKFENSEFPAKLWVARNAVALPEAHKVKRDPKAVLYCSSPDRGLLSTIRVVEEARKFDPEIKLVAAYGVTPFARKLFAQNNHRHIAELGYSMSTDEYERECNRRLDAIGGVALRRISWKKLEKLMQSCGVWLYPTRFPEISCMSAMEAQVNGCLPLCTAFGALRQTVTPSELGFIPENCDVSDAAAKLLAATRLETYDRKARAIAAYERFNVADLAEEWLNVLGLSAGISGQQERKCGVGAAAAQSSLD